MLTRGSRLALRVLARSGYVETTIRPESGIRKSAARVYFEPGPPVPGTRVRIAEDRGALGPRGVRVYRVRIQKKPRPAYIEVREDQLEKINE